MTPRKQRHRGPHHHHPTPLNQVSDYESEAYVKEPAIPPPTRTNTELNLSVLRRYNPSIASILSIAANAVIYIFTPSTQSWEKSGVEGTLFVCSQEPSHNGGERYCAVVLNRRGLENFNVDLARVQDVEISAELLIVRLLSEEEQEGVKVVGIWLHEDKDGTREINAALIKSCWEKAHQNRVVENAYGQGAQQEAFSYGEPQLGGMGGRRLSMRELFAQGGAQ